MLTDAVLSCVCVSWLHISTAVHVHWNKPHFWQQGWKWGKEVLIWPFPNPFPVTSSFPSCPFPFLPCPSLSLKVGHLKSSKGLGECCKLRSGVQGEPWPQTHFRHILRLGNASGRNNCNDFHTGMREVAVWFQADQRSAGIPYLRIPSHFKPRLTEITKQLTQFVSYEIYCTSDMDGWKRAAGGWADCVGK